MKIEIYGKPSCVYCERTKTLCELLKHTYIYEDITESTVQITLIEKIGKSFKTVPQIFIENEYIGGYTDFLNYIKRK